MTISERHRLFDLLAGHGKPREEQGAYVAGLWLRNDRQHIENAGFTMKEVLWAMRDPPEFLAGMGI